MNRGVGYVIACITSSLITASFFVRELLAWPTFFILGMAALIGLALAWQRREQCARWVGRQAFGYADAVAHRKLAIERWRKIDAGDRDMAAIESFANGRRIESEAR